MWTETALKLQNTAATLACVFAVVLGLCWAAGRARGRAARPAAIAVLLGPAALLLLVGLVGPALRTVYLSFGDADGHRFDGIANYRWAFTDPGIQQVLLNTLLWIVVAPLACTGLGLALALLVDRMRGQALWKALVFLPLAVSFVGASVVWKFVYDYRQPSAPQIGLLSQVCAWLGWHHPPNWLLTHPLNNFLLMVVMVWVQTGFALVVLSAAVKAVPEAVTEAAVLDGAHGWRLFWHVTVPMIRNSLIVVLTTVMITTLKLFDIIRTMTGGNFGTQVLANEMYAQSFTQFDTGRGSALAVVLFVAVLPLVAWTVLQLRRERTVR